VAEWLADHYDEAERGESSAGLIARHYRAAADLLTEMGRRDGAALVEKAIHWLIVAGRKADAHDSNYAAATFFAQAFDLLGSEDPRRVAVSLGRARARLSLRELAGARADAEAALDLAERLGDDAGAASAVSILGQAASAQGEHERAGELLTKAIARWSELGDDAELAEVLRLRGMAAMQEGQFDRADEDFGGALDIFTTIGDAGGQAWCQQSLAWLSFELGRVTEAEHRLERALDLFTRIDDAQGLTFSNGLLAFLRLHQGRAGEAERLATETLAEASERGERFGEAMMLLLLASLQLWSGRARSAVEGAQAARELFERIENQYGVIQSVGLMARADSALGNIDRSRAEVESVIALAGRLPGGTLDGFAQLVAAGSAVQQGDGARALAVLEAVSEAPLPADEATAMLGVLDREVSRGLALLQTGSFDEAMKLLEGISPGITADSGPLAYLHSTLALALAVHGRDDEALALVETVLSGEECTYLDRRAANIAEGLIHARRGDAEAVEVVFDRAIAEIDATDSRMSQAVVRLAHGVALEALGSPEAADVRQDAEGRFADLDLDMRGWATVFMGVTVGPFDLPAKS
jgi:tetratricopeptide (TPR) repeat protein